MNNEPRYFPRIMVGGIWKYIDNTTGLSSDIPDYAINYSRFEDAFSYLQQTYSKFEVENVDIQKLQKQWKAV